MPGHLAGREPFFQHAADALATHIFFVGRDPRNRQPLTPELLRQPLGSAATQQAHEHLAVFDFFGHVQVVAVAVPGSQAQRGGEADHCRDVVEGGVALFHRAPCSENIVGDADGDAMADSNALGALTWGETGVEAPAKGLG